jgi:hypothetical protein
MKSMKQFLNEEKDEYKVTVTVRDARKANDIAKDTFQVSR